MNVAFVLTGGTLLGLGHVSRCLKLVSLLQRMRSLHIRQFNFFVLERPGNSSKPVFEFINSVHPSATISHIQSFSEMESISDAIIVDKLDTEFSEVVHYRSLSRFLIIFDDRNGGFNLADVCFNPLYARTVFFKDSPNKFFDGLEFQPSCDVDLMSAKLKYTRSIGRVCIIQGGADPRCSSFDIARNLAENCKDVSLITVVLGPGNNCEIPIGLHSKIDFVRAPIPFLTFLCGFDLVVSSVGITAFELLNCKVPTLFITSIEHEVETGNRFNTGTLKLFYGLVSSKSLSELSHDISSLDYIKFVEQYVCFCSTFYPTRFNQIFLDFFGD